MFTHFSTTVRCALTQVAVTEIRPGTGISNFTAQLFMFRYFFQGLRMEIAHMQPNNSLSLENGGGV